jgi:hypothetical protein
LSAASVSAGRIAPLVATAMLDGISDFALWQKSGSTTGGAARSAPAVPSPSRESMLSSAGAAVLSSTVNWPPGSGRSAGQETAWPAGPSWPSATLAPPAPPGPVRTLIFI